MLDEEQGDGGGPVGGGGMKAKTTSKLPTVDKKAEQTFDAATKASKKTNKTKNARMQSLRSRQCAIVMSHFATNVVRPRELSKKTKRLAQENRLRPLQTLLQLVRSMANHIVVTEPCFKTLMRQIHAWTMG